jgi:Ca2+-binding EF-hand superfamily protein
MRRNGGARSSSATTAAAAASSYAIDTNFQESEVSYKPTTVRDAARCSKARKQREEVAQAIGVDSIDSLDYKRLEMISNGIYSSKRKVRTLFKLMDQDGSKNVDAKELCHGLQECQVQVTQEECTALVNHFSQGNGALKYSQFIRMLAASR